MYFESFFTLFVCVCCGKHLGYRMSAAFLLGESGEELKWFGAGCVFSLLPNVDVNQL